MFGVLAGPEFNSPERRPTASLGILGAVQKQAVSVLKARLPENALAVRKKKAGANGKTNPGEYVCGVENLDPVIMDVLPNELVFTVADAKFDETSMESFIADHQVYGKQFVTGDIQIDGFTALNGLHSDDFEKDTQTVVFIGIATSSQIQAKGIDGFAVQISGSATINNAGPGYVCAGDWVCWCKPAEKHQTPVYTVIGIPPKKALANVKAFDILDHLRDFNADGRRYLNSIFESQVIGRALTSATQCQEFDIMLHG